MKYVKQIIVLILGCSFVACQPKELGVKEYLDWVNNPENGLKVNKEFNEYNFELFYKPAEFIAINEQRTLAIDTDKYINRVEKLKDLQYYTLKIATLSGTELLREGISSEQEYSLRLQYFSDLAQYDMKLVDGGDTLTCALFHFERNYGVAPYNNIVLAFPKVHKENYSKTFMFSEPVLGVGKVNLKIEEESINNIPKVILN